MVKKKKEIKPSKKESSRVIEAPIKKYMSPEFQNYVGIILDAPRDRLRPFAQQNEDFIYRG